MKMHFCNKKKLSNLKKKINLDRMHGAAICNLQNVYSGRQGKKIRIRVPPKW